jgi:ADP-heptose:LPS heptosyltransferase
VSVPQRVLVIEPWHIGDVVLTTPMLLALRETLPSVRISMLAKAHAREILDASGLVDDFIVADLPWTKATNKYPLTLATVRQLRSLVNELRRRNFDVTIDARMDIRSNLVAALTRAPIRIGYDIGGGGWLLTNTIPAERDGFHKVDDWLALLRLVPGASAIERLPRVPRLTVGESELSDARRRLFSQTPLTGPVIGYHSGGSHPGKRWPLPLFEKLAEDIGSSLGGTPVFFLGPDDEAPSRLPRGATLRRPTLREFMAEVSLCDVLVCNDSGPMHIADALGVPVVAIFEVGNPQWYGPSGPGAVVVTSELAGTGMSAVPLDAPPQRPVPVQLVRDAVQRVLTEQSRPQERMPATSR